MRKASHRLAALGILVLALCVAPPARAVESNGALKPGDVLDQSNWQKAEGLLLPEVLEHYKAGEFVNPIAEWPEGLQHYAQDFLKGTEENAGRFKLDEQGTILDNTSGRQPDYIMGLPFPQIDPADPQAAVKILWNYYYQWWDNGNALGNTAVEWVNATGLDRRSIQSVRFLY